MKNKQDIPGAVILRQKSKKNVKPKSMKIKFIPSRFQKFRPTRKQIFIYSLALFLIISEVSAIAYYQIALAENHQTTIPKPQPNAKISPTEVIGQQLVTNDLGIEEGSYAGEVVSKVDVNIYSPREGIIQTLTVNIGDNVWQGQSIGYLSITAEFDQIATTAEKKTEVDISRNKLDAVNAQLNEIRNRLNSRKSSADGAKSAKVNNANNALSIGEITSQEKEERIKEAESDYSEVVTEADNEITNLTREQKETEKEFQASEALSKTVSGGIDRNIYAARAGVISGIFKNVGDYVTGEDQIAAVGITNPSANDRCVRFKIPGNQTLPKKGDVVTMTRPGEPFNKQTATITGVGTALDDNGQFVAEAFFEEIVAWPVHAPVRVQMESVTSNQIFVPLSTIWFDKEGITSVWIADNQNKITAYNVTTGRAVGDRIEIKDGLQKGDKVILQPKPDFKNGDTIQETGGTGTNQSGEEVTPAGDGHGHEH